MGHNLTLTLSLASGPLAGDPLPPGAEAATRGILAAARDMAGRFDSAPHGRPTGGGIFFYSFSVEPFVTSSRSLKRWQRVHSSNGKPKLKPDLFFMYVPVPPEIVSALL